MSMNIRSQIVPRVSRVRRGGKLMNGAIYASLLVLIVSIASANYRPPVDVMSEPASYVNALQTSPGIVKPSVDQLAVANLAAQTATVAGLSVANDVSSMSITLHANSEISQIDEAVIAKPHTFEPTSSDAIITHHTTENDTVQTVATKYGVTAQTIKWANNLTTDTLNANADILVPTVDGVVYTTKDGDTLDSIADKYKSNTSRIVTKNNLELTGMVAGQRIVLPDGVLPAEEQPGYVAPRSRTSIPSRGDATPRSANSAYAVQAGNRYSYGYCTWYAYNRRVQLGLPVGSFWGNASSWAYMASMAGYTVNHIPSIGAIMQNGGGAGHVAVVESIGDDGSVTVSEMNYYGLGGGWARMSYRTLDASEASAYNFIK